MTSSRLLFWMTALLANACARQQVDPAIPMPFYDGMSVDVDQDSSLVVDDTPQPGDQSAPIDKMVLDDVGPPPPDMGRSCGGGLTDCGGVCRDLMGDPMHCGMCGRSCPSGQTCQAGNCACTGSEMYCGGMCRDTMSDPMNCGACARACPMGLSCSGGACMLVCPMNETNCGGACRALATDAMHCGMCGRPCPAGNRCVGGVCMAGMVGGPAFRVQWLGSTNCRSVEHVSVTGADRGGIAIANANVFYTGQTATGRFGVASLEAMTVMGQRYDALVSNLRNGVVYTFVNAMGTPLTPPGDIAVALREIDGNTGALTTRQVMLSSPIAMMGAASGSTIGFFSGWDRILVMTNGRAYNIDMPAGAVTDLGSSTLPARSVCNTWAFWGVAEMSAGIAYITYVSDPTTISRRPLPTGPVTPVSQFMSLGNMCGFTIAPAAQRWYFHHARGSQLGGSPTAMETLGYCDASSTIAGPLCPSGATSCGGVCRTLSTDPMNCGACNNVCVAGAACIDGMCRGAPMRYMRTTPPMTVPFVDACVTPGHQTLLRSVDDAAAVVQLPFDFRYWGATVRMGSDVSISSNGFMTFGSSTMGTPISGMIPATALPNGVIAPQWRDLTTRADGVCVTTVGVAPDRRFVVHWSNVANYSLLGSMGSLSFEVALNERDQSIDFIYAGMTGAQMSTVGLENNAGTEAIGACPMMSATSCVIAPSTRVRFVPSP